MNSELAVDKSLSVIYVWDFLKLTEIGNIGIKFVAAGRKITRMMSDSWLCGNIPKERSLPLNN